MKGTQASKGAIVIFIAALIFFGAFSYGIIKVDYMMINAVPYVKAIKTIPPYVRITDDMVMVDHVAIKNAKPGVIKEKKDVVGQISKSEIPKDTPVYLGQLGYQGENTLTSQLTEMGSPKDRGKSLPVENLLGLDGDIKVGDRVDVTGSLKLPLNGVQTPTGNIVADKVKVLGVIYDPNNKKMTGIKLAVSRQAGQDIDFVIANGGKIGLMLCPYGAEDSPVVPTTPQTFIARHMSVPEKTDVAASGDTTGATNVAERQ